MKIEDRVFWGEFKSFVLAQVGKPYIFGAEVDVNDPNPKAWDCSELVEISYRRQGVDCPDGACNQVKVSTRVHSPKLGDLGFKQSKDGHVYHVGIFIEPGLVVEARGSQYGVVKRDQSAFEKYDFMGWYRLNQLDKEVV